MEKGRGSPTSCVARIIVWIQDRSKVGVDGCDTIRKLMHPGLAQDNAICCQEPVNQDRIVLRHISCAALLQYQKQRLNQCSCCPKKRYQTLLWSANTKKLNSCKKLQEAEQLHLLAHEWVQSGPMSRGHVYHRQISA